MVPQDWRDYTHAGWVPTTSGHMSFSNIGRSRPSTYTFNPLSNPTCPDDASICAMQWRTNRDPVWPLRLLGALRQTLFKRRSNPESRWGKFLDKWFPTHLRNAFLMIGKVGQAPIPYLQEGPIQPKDPLLVRNDPRTAIHGEIAVFQIQRGIKARWRSFQLLRKARATIAFDGIASETASESGTVPTCTMSSEERLGALIRLGRISGAFGAARVQFLLFRTGELRMKMAVETNRDDALLAQAYLFFKDIAHHHHHHRAEDDQHLSLLRFRQDQNQNLPIDDVTWRKRTLWSLAKTSGQFRREDELSRRRQSAGFIAYAEAFQRLLGRSRRDGGDFRYCPEIATYDFSSQKQSIATKNEHDSWLRQGVGAAVTAGIASTISLILLYASLSGIANARFLCQGLMSSGFCGQTHIHPVTALVIWFMAIAAIAYTYNWHFASKWRINSSAKKYVVRPARLIAMNDRSLSIFSMIVVAFAAYAFLLAD